MSLHADTERAKKDAPFHTALVSSLRRYRGCPSCEWTGMISGAVVAKAAGVTGYVPDVECGDCHAYRRALLWDATT